MLIDDLRSFGRDLRGVDREAIRQLLFDAASALDAAYISAAVWCQEPSDDEKIDRAEEVLSKSDGETK